MANSTNELTRQVYKKRPGTSGIRGQLYETKLLSLIFYKALHDDNIEEFLLGTNLNGIGIFDDIVIRDKVKGFDKPVVVFIQAKHKENANILRSKKKLVDYFDSYLKIRRAFQPNNKNVLFEGKFCDTECLFVVYTNAKDDGNNKPYEGSLAKYLDNRIATARANHHHITHSGLQPSYSGRDVELLNQQVMEEQFITLAQKMTKYWFDDAENQMMNDELVLRYHVILAQQVFDISEIQPEGHRIASFRQDFFGESELFLQIFKETLCSEILKRRKVVKNETQDLMKHFSSNYDDVKFLSKLIGSIIIFKNGEFEFCDNFNKQLREWYQEKLDSVTYYAWKKKQAVELAVKECIPSLQLKVPAAFGNKDLLIRGGNVKIEKRLDHLIGKLIGLIEKTKPNSIVTIDESMRDGFLRLNGGIASAIGSIFVLDESSKLLKFCENSDSLGNLAKIFFAKLQKKEITNIYDYKFDVKIEIFPKLTLDRSEYDENKVKDFLSKLIFYTNQSNENYVEKILKDEIRNSQALVHNVEIKTEAIFLKYHDEVQKWWMTPSEGSYLTKESELYKKAVDGTSQPLTYIINMMFQRKYKDNPFNEDAVNSLASQNQPSGTVITTENSAFTVAKILRYMKNKDLVVFDLEYILNLPATDFNTLRLELADTNKAQVLIIVVDKFQNTKITSERLENIAGILKDQYCIIVAAQSSVKMVNKYFSVTNIIKDERNNLTDMSEESQKSILENSKVIFQGGEVSLGKVLDDVSITNIGGDVLHKIMHGNKNILGKLFVDANYLRTIKIPEILIKTKVSQVFEGNVNQNNDDKDHCISLEEFHLHDELKGMTGDVVVVIADPGMGKTTFLSQLSCQMKQFNPRVWILRINLLEYVREFSQWQKDKTKINTLESLKFMCQVALSEESSKINKVKITLEESNGNVHLKDCTGDEWAVFELKMFLHYYNAAQVVILLDGYDEICPHYAHEVLTFIKVIEKHHLRHKIWITSRSYHKIVSILELHFGTLYQIKPWNHYKSKNYLFTIWNDKKILKRLNNDQLENVYNFITFMSKTDIKGMSKKRILQIQLKKEIPFSRIYFWFIKYLECELSFAPPNVMRSLHKICEEDDSNNRSQMKEDFDATPLHLQLISDYLYNKIRETHENPNQWPIDTNIFKVYESFLEMKVKRIRFQEKNQVDMYRPDIVLLYEKEYADLVAKHKKLAAHAVFHRYHDKLFDTNELEELKHLIDMLEKGVEKTGIICKVVNDIPIFEHSSFAEYFAVEFICDLLKGTNGCKEKSSTEKGKQKSIWDFILNVMFFNCNKDVLATFEAKIEIDTELTEIFQGKNKEVIFELLLEQSKNTEIKSSLCEAIRHDLRNLGMLLLSTIENNLDENNLMDFIKIVKETKMLMIAIKMEFEDIIVSIINHVKMVDKTKLSELFDNVENFEINEDIAEVNTDELIRKLHEHVWRRMDIVPDWKNLAELSGQIYFI